MKTDNYFRLSSLALYYAFYLQYNNKWCFALFQILKQEG